MVGYIIAVSTFSVGGRYVSMFLMASGYAGTRTTSFYSEQSFLILIVKLYCDRVCIDIGVGIKRYPASTYKTSRRDWHCEWFREHRQLVCSHASLS